MSDKENNVQEEPFKQEDITIPKPKKELTNGQRLIGVNFNPAENPDVYEIKLVAAYLHNRITELKDRHEDVPRWKAAAKTYVEIGSMLAVKGVVA